LVRTRTKLLRRGTNEIVGHNALRALKGLGILDAVLARGDDALRTERRMLFVSGLGEHEEVYDYNNSVGFYLNVSLKKPNPRPAGIRTQRDWDSHLQARHQSTHLEDS
jgi:hypothetical protein